VDHSPGATLGHYSAFRAIDIPALRRELAALRAMSREELQRASPLNAPGHAPLPPYFVTDLDVSSDLNASAGGSPAELIRTLNAAGWWPTLLQATSNPYRGPGPATPVPGDFRTTRVGDTSDTSPYIADQPVTGISTATYIANMAALIRALNDRAPER
jgi:hypothetical protein